MAPDDKNWAKQYLLDPLTAPQPADETGPGSHFRPEPEAEDLGRITPPSTDANNVRSRHASPKTVSASTREVSSSYPSPPYSTSPRRTPASHRQEAFQEEPRRRRGSSLNGRFPGDMSHRPLDQLTQEKAVADRARHATKKHHIQPDQIDKLDGAAAGGAYHHGGPYDATLFARNNSYTSSPVAAVASTNAEALKATPHDKIVDSVDGHRPLDGVAAFPPGTTDRDGTTYSYQEGDNMMIAGDPEGGAYKRWPGVQYHPDDIKGKSEPSYSVEKALKKNNNVHDNGGEGIEMSSHSRHSSDSYRKQAFLDDESAPRRSGSFSKRLSGGLKKRISSITKAAKHED